MFAQGDRDRLYAMKSIHMTRLSKSRVQEFENEVSMRVNTPLSLFQLFEWEDFVNVFAASALLDPMQMCICVCARLPVV